MSATLAYGSWPRRKAAEATWRRLDGQDLVPLVRAGVRFVDGKRVEREADDISNEGMKKARRAAA